MTLAPKSSILVILNFFRPETTNWTQMRLWQPLGVCTTHLEGHQIFFKNGQKSRFFDPFSGLLSTLSGVILRAQWPDFKDFMVFEVSWSTAISNKPPKN